MENFEKLSDAIRAGSKKHRQTFDWCDVETDKDGKIVRTSAIGAAIYACFGDIFLQGMADDNLKPIEALQEKFPFLKLKYGSGRETMTVASRIEIYNHAGHWSREKIADWVEQFEK
jgi:hypothetical protein